MTRRGRNLGEFLSREHGALVWLPGVLIAAAFVLFAIHQAPAELTLYTQSRATRVVLGPLHGPASDAFVHGLRQSLAAHREVSVLSADVVQACMQDAVGGAAPVQAETAGSLAWIRATRSLKAQFYIGGEVRQEGDGLAAVVEVWEASSERVLHRVVASRRDPATLGAAVGDSVAARLFEVAPEP